MKMYTYLDKILVFATVLVLASGLPVKNAQEKQSAWELSGKFEGDIILTSPEDRHGLLDSQRYWPNRTLVYYIDPSFDTTQHDAILDALNDYEELTCLHVRERGPEDTRYVHIKDGEEGCFSAIGMMSKAQTLNLGEERCFAHGTIVHELMHAWGFYHQQAAADRDDHVDILWSNIIPGDVANFLKFPNSTTSDFGVGYDYGSVMHYGRYAFSSNGEPTILPKDESAEIGQREGLSSKDIEKLELMYGC